MFKRVTITSIIVFILSFNYVLAALNEYSIDLEKNNSQSLFRTNANLSADFPGKDSDGHTGSMTVEMWIKPESITAASNDLAGKWLSSGAQRSFRIETRSSGKIQFGVSSDGTETFSQALFYITDNIVLAVNNWYHVAACFNDVSNDMQIYVNGVSVPVTNNYGITTGGVFLSTANFYVGARESGTVANFDGLIDEVIVWTEARTATQIAQSYNSGNGKIYTGSETNMIAYYRLENNTLDETANNNDLTKSNAPVFSMDVPFPGEEPAEIRRVYFVN